MSEPILIALGVSKVFRGGGLEVPVLSAINLVVEPGETVAIIGASGSGKSTLLHLLGGLDTPTAGKVTLMGREFSDMGEVERGDWRNRHLGFVYQFHHLLAEFSALENVAMPLLIRRMERQAAMDKAAEILLRSVSATASSTGRANSPAVNASGRRSRVLWSATPPVCSPMNQPVIWTVIRRQWSLAC